MNNVRRKQIAQAQDLLSQALTLLEVAADEEQDYYDNLPESLQSAEKGENAAADAESLGEARDSVQEAIDAIDQLSS